jgi:transmembrane sensor
MSAPREQAARWFARLQRAPQDHPEREQFQRWLAADPRNASEYQAFSDLWGDFASTVRTENLALAMERQRGRQCRKIMGGSLCGLVLTLGCYLGVHLYRHGPLDTQLQTRIGERQQEHLRDGSELYLNADTRLQVHYDGSQRHIDLQRGEAIFDIAHDAQRPFVIDGGLARVTVLGTRFVVNRLPDRLRISVERGLVRVQSKSNPATTELVKVGQVLEVGADGSVQRLPVSAANAFAFEHGSLVFDQADLGEIAASLSRYRPQPVRFRQDGRKPTRINAVVQIADIEGFLSALPAIAPVRLEQATEATVIRQR